MEDYYLDYDKEKGMVFFHEVSCQIDTPYFPSLLQEGYEKLVGPTTKVIIHTAVKRSNTPFFNKLVPGKNDPDQRLSHILDLFKQLGYGDVEIVEADEENGEYVLEVNDCFNCSAYGQKQKPVCYMMSAKLASAFEASYHKRAECKEIECSAVKGYDRCLFEVSITDEEIEIADEEVATVDESREYDKVEIEYDGEGNIRYKKTNTFIAPRDEWVEIRHEFEKMISQAARKATYSASKNAGVKLMGPVTKRVVQFFGKISEKKVVLELLKQIPERGLGHAELMEFKEEGPMSCIKIENSADIKHDKDADKPVCALLSGFIAGAAETIFNRSMDCTETKCVATGDEHCEFLVGPSEEN